MLKRARLLCYSVLCVSRAVLSVVLGAWSVRFVGWADWVECRCFLSFVFLGVARRLELSPCTTPLAIALYGPYRRGSQVSVSKCASPGCGFVHSTFCQPAMQGLVHLATGPGEAQQQSTQEQEPHNKQSCLTWCWPTYDVATGSPSRTSTSSYKRVEGQATACMEERISTFQKPMQPACMPCRLSTA